MNELAKLIVFEVAYQYWRVACGCPTRSVYMTSFLRPPVA